MLQRHGGSHGQRRRLPLAVVQMLLLFQWTCTSWPGAHSAHVGSVLPILPSDHGQALVVARGLRVSENATRGGRGGGDANPAANTASMPAYEYALSVVSSDGPVPGDPKDDIPAVVNGSVGAMFSNCSSRATDKAEEEESRCLVASPYADRLTFRLNFLQNESLARENIRDHAPRVSADGGRANPVATAVDVDRNHPYAVFAVKYMCETPSDAASEPNASSTITMTVELGPTRVVDLVWTKICGSGHFDPVLFGYRNHENQVIQFNDDGTHGKDKDVGLEVSPHDLTTVLSLTLKPSSAGSLDFLAPYVTSSDPGKAAFVVRSALMGGTVWAGEADHLAEISIMYDCKEAVRAEFSVSIAIPPWDNLTATWTKDCGGHVPRSLLIGTSVSSNFDVLQDGELNPAYNITDKTSVLGARISKKKIIDMGTHSSIFYISNIDESSEIHIQSVTLTLAPSDMMVAFLESPRMAPVIGTGYIGKTGATLGRKETKRLQIHFYCRKSGSVVVLVTLATLLFQNVEFGFIKECIPGIAHQRHALTAGSLMSGLFTAFLFASVLACCFVIRKRRKDAQKAAAAAAGTTTGSRKVRGKYTLVDADDDELEY